LNPAASFFYSPVLLKKYDFVLPWYFQVSVCVPAGPHLLAARGHFLKKSAKDNADIPG
jgi:hypothetical protein